MQTVFKACALAAIVGVPLATAAPAAASTAADRQQVVAAQGQQFAAERRHNRRNRVVVRTRGGRAVVRFQRFKIGHIRHLNAVQLKHWHGGRWWQGTRHGRVGWWWFAGGIWYWYPAAVYPYPTEISAEAVYDYAPEGRSDDSWYYCDDPEGYYPYVKTCNGDWKPVPIQPQAGGDDGVYGEPPMGDDEGAYDDEGGGGDEMGDEDDDSNQ